MASGDTLTAPANDSGSSANGKRPNVVFILADNLGWGDLGCYGSAVPTPRIDALARDGMRFTNYTVENQCTPTRSAIMTGRLPVRSGTVTVPIPGQGAYGLVPWEYTLAELLSEAGYATAAFGKWHLGDVPGRLPTDQGFDTWWGIKNTSDEAGYTAYPLYAATGFPAPRLWEAARSEPACPAGDLDLASRPFLDEQIAQRSVDFITRNAAADAPFFLYTAFTQLHPPMLPHPDFAGKTGSTYADILAELDYRTGHILDAIDAAGIADNTIVIWSSDNASLGVPVPGGDGGSNGPWRGDFMTPPFEGSFRVAALARWPGHVPAGVVTGEILTAVDWLPTIAGLVGAADLVPTDRPIDGMDASAFVTGQSAGSGRDHVLYFGPDASLMAVKWRTIKVVFRYSLGIDQPIVTPLFPLTFDLLADPHEAVNLFARKMDNGWMGGIAYQPIHAYERSVAQYLNIPPGADFSGYP